MIFVRQLLGNPPCQHTHFYGHPRSHISNLTNTYSINRMQQLGLEHLSGLEKLVGLFWCVRYMRMRFRALSSVRSIVSLFGNRGQKQSRGEKALQTWLAILVLLLFAAVAQAQQPGVDCVPVQGQGWQGCAPTGNQQQPAVRWQDRMGAIATDGPGGHLGANLTGASVKAAEQAAIANCKANGGLECTVEASWTNGCGAMTVGSKLHNSVSAATLEEATRKGMQLCQKVDTNCHTFYSGCSRPVQVR